MKKSSRSFYTMKLRVSARSLHWLFSHLRYAVTAVLVSLLFFELVYWMFNAGTFWTLMTSPRLSLGDKFGQLTGPFSYVQTQNGPVIFTLMLLLAFVQGLSLTALAYAVRHQPKTDGKLMGESAFVSALALFGLGCPACGTSLITPIVSLFISSSATSVSLAIRNILLPLAILIGLYGLYVLGLRISAIRAQNDDTTMRYHRLIKRLKRLGSSERKAAWMNPM